MTDIDMVIQIRKGKIEDASEDLQVDAIVNAANPTLMGGSDNVDGAIHNKIDELRGKSGVLKRRVKKEIDKDKNAGDTRIRCERGEVVVTSGCGLCKFIMHTVGPKSDAKMGGPLVCSNSQIKILESCYKNIITEAIERREIRKIAIPVISAGHYGLGFETALKVGIATLHNTLLEIKQRDEEYFRYIALDRIYFVIPDENQNLEIAYRIMDKYQKIIQKERRIVYRSSYESQLGCLKDIILYDNCKGYFSVAKSLRILVVIMRLILFPFTYLKDIIGKSDWIKRRTVVECITVIKMLIPIVAYLIIKWDGVEWCSVIMCILMVYDLADTITYLLSLIILADIQNPSANTIRSLIMLIINYLEVSLDISVVYYYLYRGQMMFRDAMAFGILGIDSGIAAKKWFEYGVLYLNQGTKFFFLTLAFAYFSSHLQQRKFRNILP